MSNYTLDETKECLSLVSNIFIDWTEQVLDINDLEKLSIIGVGNSISSGWSNHSDDVKPLISKLDSYILGKANKRGICITTSSFPIAHNNSNENIYKFLSNNPSLSDVRNYFKQTLDAWKTDFGTTPLKYTIDKQSAINLYPDSDLHLDDFFDERTLSLVNFNGFTGEFLSNIKGGLTNAIDRELFFMEKIIELFLSKSNNSYMTVGNFPVFPKANPLNILINKKVNSRIQELISKSNKVVPGRVMYFDKTYLNFINLKDDEALNILEAIRKARSLSIIKIDNHPNTKLQYLYLSRYLLFIMQVLPKYIAWYKREYFSNDIVASKNVNLAHDFTNRIQSLNLHKL